METNDEWITQRTGIRRRHVLGEDETLVCLDARVWEACRVKQPLIGKSMEEPEFEFICNCNS